MNDGCFRLIMAASQEKLHELLTEDSTAFTEAEKQQIASVLKRAKVCSL